MSDRLERWADSVVTRWNRMLVRRLPEAIAHDRVGQIESDLWEQRHADTGPQARLTRSILLRALRGVPADLLWRRAVRGAAEAESSSRRYHRSRGTSMSSKHDRQTKPWVHLTDIEKPFDQTNGAVDFDTPDKHDSSDVGADMMARGVAANTVNVGFGGGL